MLLNLKDSAKVMLKANKDIHNSILNGQTGIIRYIEFPQGSVCKVF